MREVRVVVGAWVQVLESEIRDCGAFVSGLNAEIRASSHSRVEIIRFPDTEVAELRICGSDQQENTPQSRITKIY